MTPCEKCGKNGDMKFYEQYFFCRDHWREAYKLVFDAQKVVTRETIENYVKPVDKNEPR